MLDLESICLFAGYIITADGQIHNWELAVLDQFIEQNALAQQVKEQLHQIFADGTDKPPIGAVIERLTAAGEETHRQALIVGLSTAYADGYLDPAEHMLFEQLLTRTQFDRSAYNELKGLAGDHPHTAASIEQSNAFLRIVATKLQPLVKGLAAVAPLKIREQLERFNTRLLLVGPEYEQAIHTCTAIAEADFVFVEQHLRKNSVDIKHLIGAVERALAVIAQEKDVEEFNVRALLTDLRSTINERLISRLERNREALYKKQRAMRSFTIAFIGKTKAGKSTLHAVITGEGADFIGEGAQRTTRYNRVYSWKNIRIIDTPGIGAPGGQTDEQIAESVLDEADIVCYVIKNDSIQEAEFSFLERVRAKRKPVIILLNVKENLIDEYRLKTYLKEPDKWFTRSDEKGLQGHINRVTRYATMYYQNPYLRIYPVQLLAARMAQEVEHASYAGTLYRSSHLQEFLDAIRVSLIEEGVLRRSQTLLDGTQHVFTETHAELVRMKMPLYEMRDRLQVKQVTLERELQKSYNQCDRDIINAIDEGFRALIEHAHLFAAEHYNDSPNAIKWTWERYLQRISFTKGLEAAVTPLISRYLGDVEDYLSEISQDFVAFNDFRLGQINVTGHTSFNMHTMLQVGSIIGGLGAAAFAVLALFGIVTGPLGLIFTGAAVGMSLLKHFFTSPHKRAREATQKLANSLIKHIDEQKRQTLQFARDQFADTHTKTVTMLSRFFMLLIRTLDMSVKELEVFEMTVVSHTAELNNVFAWRVINYARYGMDAPTTIDPRQIKADILGICRNQHESFQIFSRQEMDADTMERLSAILQERVMISPPSDDQSVQCPDAQTTDVSAYGVSA